jgi:GTP-binding protein HflX
LNDQLTVLISDTVGFINKLPHHLIASFQSTLAQAQEADILLHIVDLSNNGHEHHIRTVEGILRELGIIDKPTVIVFNKVDKVKDERTLSSVSQNYSNALYVSALKKIRLENIKMTLLKIFREK